MAQSARTGRFKISRSKTLPASRRERAEVTYNKDLKQNERETRNYVDGWSTDSMHLSDDLNLINSNDNSTEAVDRGPRSNETSSSDLNVAKYLKSASELALEVGEHQQSDLEVNLPNLEVTCVTVDDGELRQGLHPYYTPPRVDSSSFHDNVAQPQDNFDSTDESERDILITIIGTEETPQDDISYYDNNHSVNVQWTGPESKRPTRHRAISCCCCATQ